MRPPMLRAQSERCVPKRSSSMEGGTYKKNGISISEDKVITEIKDDIDAHRHINNDIRRISSGGNSGCSNSNHSNLSISESTRRILERMDETQVNDAMAQMESMQATRRRSGLDRSNSSASAGSRRSSRMSIKSVGEDNNGDNLEQRCNGNSLAAMASGEMGMLGELSDEGDSAEENDDCNKGGEEEKAEVISPAEDRKADSKAVAIADRHRMSKSLGALQDAFDDASFSDDDDDDDNDNDTWDEGDFKKQSQQLKEITEETTFTNKGVDNNNTDKDLSSEPVEPRRRARRERRGGILSTSLNAGVVDGKKTDAWKPLSSNQHDPKPKEDEDADDDNQRGDEAGKGKGIGGLWNKLTSSFTTEQQKTTPNVQPQCQKTGATTKPVSKKEIDGATYFRRGKRRANKCQFLQAVTLFNFALVRQREKLGENHIDCGTTLNEIGVCWMMLGERYPALTAFEEALYIYQRKLGDGAMEVAEITNNIWMILHEERCETENMMEEGDEEDFDDDDDDDHGEVENEKIEG